MLEGWQNSELFEDYYGVLCRLLSEDPLKSAERDPDSINRNAVSSMLTVVVSCLCLDRLRRSTTNSQPQDPIATAGYSVGQWTALYAAGIVDWETLLKVVKRRAELMDECISEVPSGMLGVIGLKLSQLEEVCSEAMDKGMVLEVSNHNSIAQFSLAGTDSAITFAECRLVEMNPKIVRRLPVAGAWHSSLLKLAAEKFEDYLESIEFFTTRIPVISNVTESWLPEDGAKLRHELADQIARPVLWAQGVREIINYGAGSLIEVGFGDTLTRFGMFLDRSVKHTRFCLPPESAI